MSPHHEALKAVQSKFVQFEDFFVIPKEIVRAVRRDPFVIFVDATDRWTALRAEQDCDGFASAETVYNAAGVGVYELYDAGLIDWETWQAHERSQQQSQVDWQIAQAKQCLEVAGYRIEPIK